ncbi:intein [Dysgonomonas alginatilytica]|uniref:Intein n=1 Tax=Dysgonomonas alginatilytica TaxID=1605892 RepID=A0A2V3PWR0_9BACT|nr:Hint domain-containing protein [Dysgonomonas alginatilytica]PXV69291.1 intein [Dysgonomonas alginatilytica]
MKTKNWMVCILFVIMQMNALGQNIPVIETRITSPYSFTDTELKLDEELESLLKKYPALYSDNDSYKNQIPAKDRERFEYIINKKGENFESMVWSTDPMGCSWYCGAYHFETVSSSLSSTSSSGYDASSIFDFDVRTAWVEGAKGYGIGEYVEVHFPINYAQATDCYIVNGYNKDERIWKNNSRVKTMNLYVDEKLIGIVNLKDTRDEQSFSLPDTIPNLSDTTAFKIMEVEGEKYKVSTLKFLLTDVYRGDKYDDTAISELFFNGIGVHCIVEGANVSMVDGLTKNIENIKPGDSLLTYNLKENKYSKKKVKLIHSVYHDTLYTLGLSNGESITVTDDHPFLSSMGWVSIAPSKTKKYKRYANQQVYELKIGTQLLAKDFSSETVNNISQITNRRKTYTLEFEEDGLAFVVNGVLVGQE